MHYALVPSSNHSCRLRSQPSRNFSTVYIYFVNFYSCTRNYENVIATLSDNHLEFGLKLADVISLLSTSGCHSCLSCLLFVTRFMLVRCRRPRGNMHNKKEKWENSQSVPFGKQNSENVPFSGITTNKRLLIITSISKLLQFFATTSP